MAQPTAPVEPHILPPSIPIRSHLRNGSAYQQKLRAIKSTPMNPESAPSFLVPQTLFKELDCALTETQQRLVSAVLEGKNMVGKRESICWDSGQESDTMTERRRTDETLRDFCFSEVGSEVSYCDDHLGPSRLDPSKIHWTASDTYGQHTMGGRSEGLFEQIEVQGCVPSLRGSRDGTTFATHMSHASCSDNTSPISDCSVEKMDAEVSDWLARGFLSPGSDEPGSPRQATSNSNRPFPPRHVRLSLSPPISLSTGNREYTPPGSPFARTACPVSLLNNGRDAYGNYIPSNKRDYFTAKSPSTSPIVHAIPGSQNSSEQASSSPIVRLRGGGWNGFKPFWKTSGTEEPAQGLGPTSLQNFDEKDGILRDIPPVNYARRPESRAPRSVRSQFSTTHVGKIQRTTKGTLGRPSTIDTKRDDHVRLGGSEARQDSNTPDSADTDDSSVGRGRVDAVLYQHFGPQLSPPVPLSPGTRLLNIQEHPTTYSRADISARAGVPSPPTDKTFIPPNLQSALAAENEYKSYSISHSPPVAKTRPTSWDILESQKTQETDGTVRSHVVSPRGNKRWDRKNPPPLRPPPPNPPRYLRAEPPEYDASGNSDDDGCRAPSMLSANTMDDKLIEMLGLDKTDAYRRVEHERAVQRLQAERRGYEEAYRRCDVNVRRQEEMLQEEPDRSTIVPDDNATVVRRRQSIEKQHGLECMPALDEDRPPSSPLLSQYLPRHGRIKAQAQVISQQRNAQYRTIGHPSLVPASEPVGPASVKRQNSLQTVISKAGELTRFMLAAPSDSKYKTYSKRNSPVKNQEEEQPRLGADATGWPRNGKFISTATHRMLIPTQAPDSRIIFGYAQPPNSRSGQTQPDNRGWEHPRGRRAKKVEKVESKRRGAKWGRRPKEKTSVGDTNAIDLASRDMHGGGSSDTSAANTNSYTARSRGATRLQHPGFARSGPRARSSSREAPTPTAGPPPVSVSVLMNQQLKHTFTSSDATGTPKTRFGPPDGEGKCYVRRNDGEVLPFNPAFGYPYHSRLNTYYDVGNPDIATLKWLEGMRAQTDANAEPIVNMRGGDILSPKSEANSLASHHRLLTSAAMFLNSGSEAIDSSDMEAPLISSTRLNLDQVTHEAIASVNRTNGDDIRPHFDGTNIRSSFSTDSTVDSRRKKKARENVWRNEDRARAMAMHSLG